MTAHHNHLEVIRALLTTPATWAVFGLSDNEGRTAYRIAQWLRVRLDMQVLPIHPSAPFDPPVLGSPGYAALAAIPDGVRVAVVDCFVRSKSAELKLAMPASKPRWYSCCRQSAARSRR